MLVDEIVQKIPPGFLTTGALNPRFPGGLELQARLLEAEGFEIEKKGKTTWRVHGFAEKLFPLDN